MAETPKILFHHPLSIRLSLLKPDPENPNRMKDAQMQALRESMQKFGYLAPIIVDQYNNVIDGHHRLMVYKEFKRETIPALVVEIKDKNQARMMRQALNKLRGAHEPTRDARELKVLYGADRLNELSILTAKPRDEFLKVLERYEGMQFGGGSTTPLPIKTELPKAGQVWALGKHRVLCGDSLDKANRDRLLGGEPLKKMVMVTDPPYGVGYQSEEWDSLNTDEFRALIKKIMDVYGEAKDKVIFGARTTLKCWTDQFPPRDIGYWLKPNCNSRGQTFQFMLTDPIMFYGEFKKKKRANDLFEYPPQSPNQEIQRLDRMLPDPDKHPPGKPVRLMMDLISSYSSQTDIVVDPFAGRGSTMLACEQTNRICYTAEVDPHVCRVAIARWEQYAGQRAELVKGNA